MKQQINKFNSVINEKQTEMVLRNVRERQDAGELLTIDQVNQAITEGLREIKSRGKIIVEVPANAGEILNSENFKEFFKFASQDIEVLFAETDQTEQSVGQMAEIIDSQLRNIDYQLGQLKSEAIERKIKIPPGSGWSKIIRDSFDRGYGQLLGRAELPYNLFKDPRTGIIHDGEDNSIKADARIDRVSKQLTLPETEIEEVGFKNIQLITSGELASTQGDLVFDTEDTIKYAINKDNGTFWSEFIFNSTQLLGVAQATIKQIGGPTSNTGSITLNLSGIKTPEKQNYFVKVIDADDPQNIIYNCYSDLQQQSKINVCKWDRGRRCHWNYEDYYSLSCTNSNCSRYTKEQLTTISGVGDLEDGYKYDTGVDIIFDSNVKAGQIWRVQIEPSGEVGATVNTELTLSRPGNINWIEIDPISNSPFELQKISYNKPGTSGLITIIEQDILVEDKVRFDFQSIEAEKLYLTFNQKNYQSIDYQLRPKNVATAEILSLRDQEKDVNIDDFYKVDMENLLLDYVPDGPLKSSIVSRTGAPHELKGYLYQVGAFHINCGYTAYADAAVAVTKRIKAVQPRMIAIQGNIEPGYTYSSNVSQEELGTIEFSIIKQNYDENNILINTDDFPLPNVNDNGYIVERLFIDNTRKGTLRFATEDISKIEVLSLGRTLTSSEYESITSAAARPETTITIKRQDVAETAIILVWYKPLTGVYLNQGQTLLLADNRNKQLSLSNLKYIVVADNKTANRTIETSNIFMRIILRRNNPKIYNTPGLRDYQLYISENDPGRFF